MLRRALNKLWFAGWCVLAGTCLPATAADYSEEVVKAAYLFRFAGYIEWPSTTDRRDFVIAVLGSPAMARELAELAHTHLINNQPVRVRAAGSIRDVADPDILYVGAGHAEALRVWRPASAAKSTLVVTDEEGGLRDGGMLNFMTVDRRVRFEVSLTAADQAHLKISAELLGLAVRVFGAPRQTRETCLPQHPGEPAPDCALRAARRCPARRPHPAAASGAV